MKMNSFSEHPIAWTAVTVVAAIVLSFVIVYASACFEAAAYERVTGKRVSPWDAMFLDLRVQESAK